MKDKNVEFSVIIPVYNCAKYLPRCIESITKQSYKNIEIILINDGSTDNSVNICQNYIKKDNRIILINKSNEGVSKARNDALKLMSGKYAIFLDSDDYLDDGYFEEINKIITQHNEIELITFGFYSDVNDRNGTDISSDIINYRENYYSSHDEIKNDLINLWDKSILYNVWNKVYLKSIIDRYNIKFIDFYFGEDVEFNKKYLNVVKNLYNSEKCFYHYIREREGAVTKEFKSDIFDIRKKEFEEFNDYFEKWGIAKADYFEFSCRRYIERILGCIENTYCTKMSFENRYKTIKMMIMDSTTRKALKYIRPKSKKIQILIIPIKLRLTLITMIMGKIFNTLKSKNPRLFNKLKNRR